MVTELTLKEEQAKRAMAALGSGDNNGKRQHWPIRTGRRPEGVGVWGGMSQERGQFSQKMQSP